MSGNIDVNHDGISDLIIGSPYAKANTKNLAETTTVIFWKEDMEKRD